MSQDPYVDPNSGVLRNRLNLTDPVLLASAEAAYTRKRLAELERRPLPGHFDLPHLQAIHRHITQDLVDWAGELRTVDIHKGFPFCRSEHLTAFATEIFKKLGAKHALRGRKRDVFVEELARFYGDLNALHPFREWNGRTQRAFMSQLAHEAGWHVAWERVDPTRNNEASFASLGGNLTPLREMLDEIVDPWPQTSGRVETQLTERHQGHERSSAPLSPGDSSQRDDALPPPTPGQLIAKGMRSAANPMPPLKPKPKPGAGPAPGSDPQERPQPLKPPGPRR